MSAVMLPPVPPELLPVTFRLAPGKVEALHDVARRRGVRRSELLRAAVDDLLAREAAHTLQEPS